MNWQRTLALSAKIEIVPHPKCNAKLINYHPAMSSVNCSCKHHTLSSTSTWLSRHWTLPPPSDGRYPPDKLAPMSFAASTKMHGAWSTRWCSFIA